MRDEHTTRILICSPKSMLNTHTYKIIFLLQFLIFLCINKHKHTTTTTTTTTITTDFQFFIVVVGLYIMRGRNVLFQFSSLRVVSQSQSSFQLLLLKSIISEQRKNETQLKKEGITSICFYLNFLLSHNKTKNDDTKLTQKILYVFFSVWLRNY